MKCCPKCGSVRFVVREIVLHNAQLFFDNNKANLVIENQAHSCYSDKVTCLQCGKLLINLTKGDHVLDWEYLD